MALKFEIEVLALIGIALTVLMQSSGVSLPIALAAAMDETKPLTQIEVDGAFLDQVKWMLERVARERHNPNPERTTRMPCSAEHGCSAESR